MTATGTAEASSPYGARVRRALPVARRALWHFNRWLAAPLFRVGLGWVFSVPFGGWIMLLRTTGRKSGRIREAGLCYAIVEGSVYVMAGFGPTTDWLRNLQADPRVEVVMPSGSAFAGRAEIVADDAEYVRAFRALDRAMFGAVRLGTFVGRDPVESAVTAVKAWFPIARIIPTGIARGAADPAGARHLLIDGILAVWLVRRAFRGRRGRP